MPTAVQDTRSRILEIALELFSKQGYEGVSLREIADRMGFTKAALYYHFNSKEQLASELLAPLVADIDRVLDTFEGRLHGAAGRRKLLEAYADVILDHRGLVRFAFADLSILNHAGLGPRTQAQGQRLAALVCPAEPSLADHVRAAVAIGGLQLALAALAAGEDRDDVRTAAVAAAFGALRQPPRRGGQ